MNYREHAIAEKYKKQGWIPIHKGAPDFIMIKHDGSEITDMRAIEVKSSKDKLTYEQKIWRDIIRKAGIKYDVEVIE